MKHAVACDVERIYVEQDLSKLDEAELPDPVKEIWRLQWRGKLRDALRFYQNLDGLDGDPHLRSLMLANKALLEVKIGHLLPDISSDALVTPLAEFVYQYAICTQSFWRDRPKAWRPLFRMGALAVRLRSAAALAMSLFLMGHLWGMSGAPRAGFLCARAMYRWCDRLHRRGRHKPFFFNIVWAAFPYALFVAGRPRSEDQAAIRRGETLLQPDPSDKSIFSVAVMYRAAEAGDIAQTEVYARKLLRQHEDDSLLRYKLFVELISLLPLALRGYAHVVDVQLRDLVARVDECADPVVRCEFLLVAALIRLRQGRQDEAAQLRHECAALAHSMGAKHVAQRHNRLFDRYSAWEVSPDSHGRLGPLLVTLIEVTGREHGSVAQYTQAVAEAIAEHIGCSDWFITEAATPECGIEPCAVFMDTYLVFRGIDANRKQFVQAQLGGVAAILHRFASLYQGIVVARETREAVALGKMARQVAHDIRSPLAVLEVLGEHAVELSAEHRSMLHATAERVQGIAQQLLEHGRNIPATSREPVVLAAVLQQIVNEKRLEFSEKAEINLDVSGGGSLVATICPQEFQRALSNLVNNAVEASPQYGRVLIRVIKRGSYAEVSVKDSGRGIPRDLLKELGRPGVTFGKDHGNGLGLSHARTFAELAGGELTIASNVGLGTEVTLRLPCMTAQAA